MLLKITDGDRTKEYNIDEINAGKIQMGFIQHPGLPLSFPAADGGLVIIGSEVLARSTIEITK